MAQIVLGAAGAVIGFYASGGNPYGAQVGWAIGSAVGGAYEMSKKRIEGPRINDLRVMGTEYGEPIPYLVGNPRVAGAIWWSSSKRTVAHSERQGKGGGPTVTSYTYEVDLLIGVSDNPIEAVSRIWANGDLIFNIRADADAATFYSSWNSSRWRRLTVYGGGASQEPDATYEAAVGAANAPAYRGRGTVFIEGLQLDGSGQLPNLTFEVCTSATGSSRVDDFNSLSSASNPEWGSMTLDATGATVIKFVYGSWYTQTTTRYNFDGSQELQATFAHQSGGFATITGSFAKIESDVPCALCTLTSSTANLRLLDANGATILSVTMPEAFVGERIRAAYRGGVLVLGQIDTTSKKIYKYVSPTITQSAAMAAWVQAVCICSDAIYALTNGGAAIYKLNLDTLALDDTITPPGSATVSSTIVGGSDAVLHYITSSGLWRWTGSAWEQLVASISPGGVNNQSGGFNDIFCYSGNVYAWAGVGVSATYSMYRVQRAVTPAAVTLQETVEALCERAGMSAADVDATDLASITRPVRAMALAQVDATRGALEQLRTAYSFDAVLADKLYFRPRGSSSVRTLTYAEIGAATDRAAEDALPVTVANDLELPPQVAVVFRNASNDYQLGTEQSDRLISGQRATQTVQLALGLTPAEAKGVADTIVIDAHASLVSTAFSTTLEHSDIEPGDVAQATDAAGKVLRLRVVRKSEGGGVLRFECVRDDASAVVSSELTDGTYTTAADILTYGETTLRTLDITILRDADDDAGYYVAARAASGTAWPGAVAQASVDDVNYTTVAQVDESAVFGTCTTTLGTHAYGAAVVDEVNSVTVSVSNGELASSTRAAVLGDETINAMQVGSELIRFITATQTGSDPNIYKLTRLLRGQRGTEAAIATHAGSELCCLLRPAGMRRVVNQPSELGQTRYVKAVTLGLANSTTDGVSFTNTGAGITPRAPVDLRVAFDATSNDITLTWLRRTRFGTRLTGTVGILCPLDEPTEAYEVDVVLVSSGAVLRTWAAATPTITYTAAEQTADSVSTATAIRFDVHQISSRIGRGTAARITTTGAV